MTLRSPILMLAMLVLATSATIFAQGVPSVFSSSEYHILSLGQISPDVSSVTQAAQSAGYTLLMYEGDAVSVDRGPLDSSVPLSTILEDPRVLIVDTGRVHLTCRGAVYRYTVRPTDSGYELVLSPSADLPVLDTLTEILLELQSLGVVGSEVNLQFSSFSKDALKGPAPPDDLFIDSALYQLTVAEDWFRFAADAGLTQVGLRVSVVAEILPGESLDASFTTFVEQAGDRLVRLLLPIDRLLALARSTAVGYVRTPRQPFVP
ncbi:MAG TPA: hypothetical protein ENN96_00220 [Candidatus Acetothermia bacterium]|nr:hypothetical protein [Candidatus Acetothermia bacterium]